MKNSKQQNQSPPKNQQAYQPINQPQIPVAKNLVDGKRDPTEFHCTVCQANRVSVLQHKAGCGTYCCCVTLCLATVILSVLPFYLRDCQDTHHICPACSTQVGVSKFKPCGCCSNDNS